MKIKIIASALYAMLFALCASAMAQQSKVYRIGFLRGAPPLESHMRIFRQSLNELGYVEGKNTRIEYRWAEGNTDQLANLAADLIRFGPDVIVADGSRPVQAVKTASSTIPVVMQSGYPVELG